MKHRIAVGASLAVALLCGSVIAAEGLKSGPQVGEGIPAFDVLVCKNAAAPARTGKLCLV